MKLFIDTANLDEIREVASWGILDGCTTNPSLIAREGRDFVATIYEICEIVKGPVSAEVVAKDVGGMLVEGRLLSRIHPHVVVKVPLTKEGLKACKALSSDGIHVNVTLCFQAAQALLAAKAGATYVSPFLGRLDDASEIGMDLVRNIVDIFGNYDDIETEVLAASIRHPVHVVEAALAGAHVATLPFKVFEALLYHPLTDIGIARFLKDWEKVPDTDIVAQVGRWLEKRGR
jgi:transaldolase